MLEKEIVLRCQEGNPKYQRLLVEKYASVLMATGMRYTNTREDAKDCMQEAWIRIFRSMEKYKSTGSLKAWMQKIVINCALAQHRKNASVVRIESTKTRKQFVSPSVLTEMNANEVLDLLKNLNYTKRTVFTLRVVEGYTHKEIGVMMNITESTSRSILTRARQELRTMITNNNKVVEL